MRRSILSARVLGALCVVAAGNVAEAQTTRVVYSSPIDTLARGYRVFLPAGQPIGLVVMLSNWGTTFHDFDTQRMQLPVTLQARGIASLQINNTPWQNNYFNNAALATIDSIVTDVMRANAIPAGRVVVGGLYMGGLGALKYAERCAEGACLMSSPIAGAFAVDPVLDLDRYWRANEAYIKRPGGRKGVRNMIMASMSRELGGTPSTIPEVFRMNSAYVHYDAEGGRASLLRSTPVRLYMDQNIQWQLSTLNDDYVTSNLADIAGLALFLRRLGNANVELMTVDARTIFVDGAPTPRTWNMIDEGDLTRWIVNLFPASKRVP